MQPPWWWPEDFWKYTLNNPTGISLFVVEILLIFTFLVHACWMIVCLTGVPFFFHSFVGWTNSGYDSALSESIPRKEGEKI